MVGGMEGGEDLTLVTLLLSLASLLLLLAMVLTLITHRQVTITTTITTTASTTLITSTTITSTTLLPPSPLESSQSTPQGQGGRGRGLACRETGEETGGERPRCWGNIWRKQEGEGVR